MSVKVFSGECPTSCDEATLYPVKFDPCTPAFEFGEINKIYVRSASAEPLTDWDSLGEWEEYLSPDGTIPSGEGGKDTIIELIVRGEWAESEEEIVEVSNFRKAYSPSSFTVNFEIDETSAENYEFLRWLECNPGIVIWIGAGKYLYGGNSGIAAELRLRQTIPMEGKKALHKFTGLAKWESKHHPERCVNPML